jgi:hypothetical protein
LLIGGKTPARHAASFGATSIRVLSHSTPPRRANSR